MNDKIIEVVIKFRDLGDGRFEFVKDAENERRMTKAFGLYAASSPACAIGPSTTIAQAQAWLEQQKQSGETVDCPLCTQEVKVYPRPLNSAMARILFIIYRYYKQPVHEEWLHVDEHLKQFGINCRYYSLLRFWGLIEAMPGRRGDGSGRTGYWRITKLGDDFIEGKISVPSYFHMFSQGVYRALGDNGFSREAVTVQDALRSGGFDYDEMMSTNTFATAAGS